MPSYNFKNMDTLEEVVLDMKIAELDTFKEQNPHMVQMLSRLNLADPTRVGITSKPDSGFRDILKEIKKNHLHSNINTF